MIWVDRYSSTMEYDHMGRWARIAYIGSGELVDGKVSSFELAWISKLVHDDVLRFCISYKFPNQGKYCFGTLEEAKAEVEDRFNFFLSECNKNKL